VGQTVAGSTILKGLFCYFGVWKEGDRGKAGMGQDLAFR
jgi:hypothetical protein